jgi:hypothetical protein
MNLDLEAFMKKSIFVIISGMDDVELNLNKPLLNDRPATPEYGDNSLKATSSQNEPIEMKAEKKMIDRNNAAFFIS